MKAQLLLEWLCGTWYRNDIRRADKNIKNRGTPFYSVDATHIQPPLGVRRRSSHNTTEGFMSFAGIRTVRLPTTSGPPLVSDSSTGAIGGVDDLTWIDVGAWLCESSF